MSLRNLYQELLSHFPVELPAGIELLNPLKGAETKRVAAEFYERFYSDAQSRYAIIGINPGRFGAGVTAIPFTDPICLQERLSIANDFKKKQELSSVFIYDMIEACGGIETFYSKFYFTAVSPFGFTRENKNLNYYDDKLLEKNIESFAVACLQMQIKSGLHSSLAFCLGEGKNFAFISKLNMQHKLFDEIVPLPHPRFIMQYRLKRKEEFIERYMQAFKLAV